METGLQVGMVRGSLAVLRDDGTILADWSESGYGTGRMLLRVYPRTRNRTPVSVPMNTLEALELCLVGRVVREAEISKAYGKSGRWFSTEGTEESLGVDSERWEARLRIRTMEWMGMNCFCPASFALAMTCCRIGCDDRTAPDGLRSFERCVSYLDAVPAARVRLHLAEKLSAEWGRLILRWDDVEDLFRTECGVGFCLSEIGPQTEALIQRIVSEQR